MQNPRNDLKHHVIHQSTRCWFADSSPRRGCHHALVRVPRNPADRRGLYRLLRHHHSRGDPGDLRPRLCRRLCPVSQRFTTNGDIGSAFYMANAIIKRKFYFKNKIRSWMIRKSFLKCVKVKKNGEWQMVRKCYLPMIVGNRRQYDWIIAFINQKNTLDSK